MEHFPRSEYRSYSQAWVEISYCVDELGQTRNIAVLDYIGKDVFRDAALEFFEGWRFEPAKIDGKPVWQSGNVITIPFDRTGSEMVVSRPFFARYKRLVKFLADSELEKASELFETLFEDDDLNLFEIAKLWALRVQYELALGNLQLADVAAHRATIFDGRWIDEENHIATLAIRASVQFETGLFGDGLRTYEKLVQVAGEDSPQARQLQPVVDKVRQALASDQVFGTSARIGRLGECAGCNNSFRFTPARRNFSFAKIDGSLSTIEAQCQLRHYTTEAAEGVQWSIPKEWGDCSINVFGEPGTTFSIVLYPET